MHFSCHFQETEEGPRDLTVDDVPSQTVETSSEPFFSLPSTSSSRAAKKRLGQTGHHVAIKRAALAVEETAREVVIIDIGISRYNRA